MKSALKYVQKIVYQLIAFLALTIGSNASAQYPYNFSYAGVPTDSKTIVRNYDENRAVVYYEEGGNGYVSLVDVVSNYALTVPLDTGFLMNDMCIMNNCVFLCGQESATFGCIVRMSLNDFYTSSVSVSYYEPSYWIKINYRRIKSFVYASDGGVIRAKFLLVGEVDYACDGSEPFPLNNFLYRNYYIDPNSQSRCTVNAVVEVSYLYTPGNPGNFASQRVMRVMNPSIHPEVVHDVVVTDNYVAFVGVESGFSDTIILHVCNRGNNILWSNYPYYSCPFETYYKFPLGTNSGSPFYHACALDGDMIAVATQDEMSASSNDITFRTFDLATHTMVSTQYLQCGSHPELKDMAYIPDLQKVVLLYYGYFRPIGSACDIFRMADPYNTAPSYTLPSISEDVLHLKYGSLDAMLGTFFITTGGKYGFMADGGGLSMGMNCYQMENCYNIDRSVIATDSWQFDYDQHDPIDVGWQTTAVPVQADIPSMCIDRH